MSFQFVLLLTLTIGSPLFRILCKLLQLGKPIQFWINLCCPLPGCSPVQKKASSCYKGCICCLAACTLPVGFAFQFSSEYFTTSMSCSDSSEGKGAAQLGTKCLKPFTKACQPEWCWKCALPWKVCVILHWRWCDFQKIQGKILYLQFYYFTY